VSDASKCCSVPGRSSECARWVIRFCDSRQEEGEEENSYVWCLPGKLRCVGRESEAFRRLMPSRSIRTR
jgi:hypothetical protein